MIKERRFATTATVGILCAAFIALRLCGAISPAPPRAEPSDELLAISAGLDDIRIDASLDVQTRTLSVTQTLTLTNRTGASLGEAALRAWPNAFQSAELSPAASDELYDSCYPDGFSMGALIMKSAEVSIEASTPTAVAWRYADEQKTLLLLPISGGWSGGSRLMLRLSYDITVPKAAYRFGVSDGIFALGNAFLIPAVYESGEWRGSPYIPIGDPFISDCANYTVRVDVPKGYVCAGSAEPTHTEGNERSVFSFYAPAVRDFALVIGEGLKAARGTEGATVITCYARDARKARETLAYARQALKCYGERYGAYPYPSLALSEICFPLGGMEYPALIMLSSDKLAMGGETLEYVVAHEIAHQWWYAAVGSDSVNQPWQDEALSEFSVLEYFETRYGRGRRDELERSDIEGAMRVSVPGGLTPGMPIGYFDSMSSYSLVVYNRGAALFCALDRLLPEGLDPFLREYFARFAFKRASREDFTELLCSATGEDLAPLITDYLDTVILN